MFYYQYIQNKSKRYLLCYCITSTKEHFIEAYFYRVFIVKISHILVITRNTENKIRWLFPRAIYGQTGLGMKHIIMPL